MRKDPFESYNQVSFERNPMDYGNEIGPLHIHFEADNFYVYGSRPWMDNLDSYGAKFAELDDNEWFSENCGDFPDDKAGILTFFKTEGA